MALLHPLLCSIALTIIPGYFPGCSISSTVGCAVQNLGACGEQKDLGSKLTFEFKWGITKARFDMCV